LTHRACIIHLFIINFFAFSKKSYNSFSYMVLCWKLNTAVAAILEFQSLLIKILLCKVPIKWSFMYSLDPIIFVVSKKRLLFISILLRTKSCIDGHLGFLISLKNHSFFKVPSIDNTCTVRVQSCLLFLRKCFNHFSIGFCVKNYCGGHLGSGEIKNLFRNDSISNKW
jgi:hypothetical protein